MFFFNYTVIPEPIGCDSDDECSDNNACEGRSCVNPCTTQNPCGFTAQCRTISHRPMCTCPIGMTGDPYSRCVPSNI